MRARRRSGAHRLPRKAVRVGLEIVFSMGILIFLFGLLLAGLGEAAMIHSKAWMTFFVAAIAGDWAVYFWTVWYGLQWLTGYEPVDEEVAAVLRSLDDSTAGHHHHSGEH